MITWLERQRLKSFIASAGWLVPVIGLGAGLVLFRISLTVDAMWRWTPLGFTTDGARLLLATFVSAMVTFIVFAYSVQLIAIQLVSTSMSPRIIALVYRARGVRGGLALFMFTFMFSTGVLGRIEDRVPEFSLSIALTLCLLSIGVFVMVIDHFGKSLRPVSLLSRIGAEGVWVLFSVYPHVLTDDDTSIAADVVRLGTPERVVERGGRSGILVAFDSRRLEVIAEQADCTIELLPQVGDFVAKGDPVFRLYGGRSATVDAAALNGAIAFGTERTLPQDPLFAFRIIVDVASKALSPAINDPTTAVLAIDQLHHMLRIVGRRRLDTGVVRDKAGRIRLVYRTPDWDDFVRLAVTEIRHFGITSIQVVRRLRAMLENLSQNLPHERVAILAEELSALNVAIERAFPDPRDRRMAAISDSQGLGSPLSRSTTLSDRGHHDGRREIGMKIASIFLAIAVFSAACAEPAPENAGNGAAPPAPQQAAEAPATEPADPDMIERALQPWTGDVDEIKNDVASARSFSAV